VRLFTAIEIPETWRAAAARYQAELDSRFKVDLRFVQREQLHVTVRFLGEVAADRVDHLTQAVEAVSPLAVELALAPPGTFGSPSRTGVVWLGIRIDDGPASELLAAVDAAINGAGLIASDQPWRPHLTLARVRRQVGSTHRRAIAQAVSDLAPPEPNPMLARTVALYQSDLGNRAPHHKLLARSAVS